MSQTEYQHEWHQMNKEKINQRHRAWYCANREKVLKRQNAYHHAHKNDPEYVEKRRLRQRQRYKEIYAWWAEYKSRLSCVRCGEKRVPCLDFHHVNPAEKDSELSKILGTKKNKDAILREIEKCIVLCANCHRMEHHK